MAIAVPSQRGHPIAQFDIEGVKPVGHLPGSARDARPMGAMDVSFDPARHNFCVPMVFFGVPVRGAWGELAVWCVLGALTFSSLGLLIASRARTIEAGSGIMNVVQLPMWVVSGVFFSSDRFPAFVQPLIRMLPLTALNEALRANMLRGESMLQMKQQAAALGVCLLVSFGAALKLFRWR